MEGRGSHPPLGTWGYSATLDLREIYMYIHVISKRAVGREGMCIHVLK